MFSKLSGDWVWQLHLIPASSPHQNKSITRYFFQMNLLEPDMYAYVYMSLYICSLDDVCRQKSLMSIKIGFILPCLKQNISGYKY